MQVFIPDDLLGLKAYTLWKDAGEPDGADFSHDARAAVERELREGSSIEDIEARLRAPPPAPEAPPDEGALCCDFHFFRWLLVLWILRISCFNWY